MDDNVPKQPRLRPGLAVLRRRPGELQVGLDPRHAAVVTGLPESVVAALKKFIPDVVIVAKT